MTTPETSKEFKSQVVVPIETTLDATAGELEKLEGDEPGKVRYLGESTDGVYGIYKFTLATLGNKRLIKNEFINQIGPWIEGTQFTDANGNELQKDRFRTGEVIYLKVPDAGKVEYLKDFHDDINRDWKIYKYKFLEGGYSALVIDEYHRQMYDNYYGYDKLFRLCDENGKELSKKIFDKGEVVYIKVPNLDVVNTTPEMSVDEIMNLSDDEIKQLFDDISSTRDSDIVDFRPDTYFGDKKGPYFIIDGKKVYDNPFGLSEYNESTPMVTYTTHESMSNLESLAIGRKVGDKYLGVYYYPDGVFNEGKVYRGELKIFDNVDEKILYPKNYFEN